MICPVCNLEMIPMGKLECRTGNARKYGCRKCRGIWFEQSEFQPLNFTPLAVTLERLARLAATS